MPFSNASGAHQSRACLATCLVEERTYNTELLLLAIPEAPPINVSGYVLKPNLLAPKQKQPA